MHAAKSRGPMLVVIAGAKTRPPASTAPASPAQIRVVNRIIASLGYLGTPTARGARRVGARRVGARRLGAKQGHLKKVIGDSVRCLRARLTFLKVASHFPHCRRVDRLAGQGANRWQATEPTQAISATLTRTTRISRHQTCKNRCSHGTALRSKHLQLGGA